MAQEMLWKGFKGYLLFRERAKGLLEHPVVGWLVILALVLMVDQALANTQNTATQVTNDVEKQIRDIVCPIVKLIGGPIARLLSLLIFVGALIYYITNDSRSAKGLAIAAIIGLILVNTFPTWQELFTQRDYDTLCKGFGKPN